MPILDLLGLLYVLPVKATVKVVDIDFHSKGDVNWDGVVDSKDLDLIRTAWHSRPGDPNWNPDADVNGDGVVNMADVAVCNANWGASAPSYITPAKAEVASGKVVVIGVYRTQKLKREFVAGTRVAFVFTVLGLCGRVILI